ncbi:MAG: SusC/RagA family TonB-linked outer membrane protein [Niabella sp.]
MLRLNSYVKKTVVVLITFFIYCAGFAQTNHLIRGKVIDEYGHPVQNIKVSEQGGNAFVLSNEDGLFEIKVNAGASLVFSGVGIDVVLYKTKITETDISVQVKKSYLIKVDTIDVLYEKRPADLFLGSVASVYTPQIATTPATLYAYALAGRLPGLYTEQLRGFRTFAGAGDVNSTEEGIIKNIAKTGLGSFSDNNEISIKLRGQNPVVIVDGIQRSIFSLDPESIESISVLKDGLSSIALGQRSSNGVLLVTTKKPKEGSPQLSFTAEVGTQKPIKLPKPVNAFDYAYLVNEALVNDGRKALYSVSDLEGFKKGDNPYRYPDVNWYDEVLKKNAPLYKYNLNLGGGGKVARYVISLNYMDQEGLLNTNNSDAKLQLQRYLVNSKVDVDVTKYFNIGVQLFGRIQDANQPGATVSSILDGLLRTPNNAYPIRNPDGSYGGNNSFQTNLRASLDKSGYIMANDRDIMANVDMRYNFDNWVKGLWGKISGNLAVQSATITERTMKMPVYQMQIGNDGDTSYARYGNGSPQISTFHPISNTRYWYAQGQIGYSKNLSTGHSFTGLVMADMRRSTLNYDLPGNATNLMAKGLYNYLEKYMFEAAVNYSGYDRYPPGHKYGVFYAFGAGWDMAKEYFIKDNAGWINQLKLRATYAHTGNGVDNSGYFIWRQTYTDGNRGVSGVDHNPAKGSKTENGMANANISWELGNKFNVGLDVSLFKNHLSVNADYYRDVYYDLLQGRGKSIQLIGTGYPAENIGKNLYTGGELAVTYQDNIGSFNYFVTANGSLQKTEVLFQDEQRRDYPWNIRTGKPVGQRFGYIADGFFQSMEEVNSGALIAGYEIRPGDIKFRDLNGDGLIDQFDQTAIGKTSPLIYYGLTTGFNYKGIGFSVLVQGVTNRNLYVDNWDTEILRGNGQVYGQMYEQLFNRWTPETATTATYPRLKANGVFGDGYTLSSSTFWLHSGNYWRIKNINLQYTFPYRWTSKFKVAGVTAFVNAQNLFTWSAYDRVDPEVQVGAYPIQKVYNMGVNIKF